MNPVTGSCIVVACFALTAGMGGAFYIIYESEGAPRWKLRWFGTQFIVSAITTIWFCINPI